MTALCLATAEPGADVSACLSDIYLATSTGNFAYAWTFQGFIPALKFGEYRLHLFCSDINHVYAFLL